MNSLYQQLNPVPQNNMISQFIEFKKTFSGNPQEIVQRMLNTGRISQAQINEYTQQANEIYRQIYGK